MSRALPALLRLTRLIISGVDAALVEQAADAKHGLQSEGYLGLHVGELLLDELVGGERPAELLAVEDVAARPLPAVLRRPHRSPGDAVAGAVEATERAREPFRVREEDWPREPGRRP